jgi:transcriptional regulator with XRE-family HTH domain
MLAEIFDTYPITQQEFADFTGIPRDRIGKWLQQKKDPPKVGDLNTINTAVNYFTTIPTEEIKQAVKNFRIFLNNVVPLAEYEQLISTGETIVMESSATYNSKQDANATHSLTGGKEKKSGNSLNLGFTKNDDPMINRLMNMLEKALANEERVTIALERTSRTSENLSAVLANYSGMPAHQSEGSKKG